ncbi:hypothetical protein PYW07_016658 [Mythimna separata]|uniref:TIL domain-containing protein n=1 Tax=Mythimna separata TaxID=271217 RepID=A0AAD8DS12_MYTSE|nr:hypothetical protein PYW07_016658 [Mythimna separata]
MASCILPICLFVAILTTVSAAPSDEKPFDCPANEKYYKCELEVCYRTCDDWKHIKGCPMIAADCYQPACLCERNTYRNAEGKCVPVVQCCQELASLHYKSPACGVLEGLRRAV